MASVPDPTLEAGLAALKKEDYPTAIAHLEGVCEIELSENVILKAQMGLVVAYDRTGNLQKAIALTNDLSRSKEPQVKEWAVRKLAEFSEQSKGATSTPSSSPIPDRSDTGFVPLDRLPPTPPRQRIPPSPPRQPASSNQADNTGFVPLDNSPQKGREAREQNINRKEKLPDSTSDISQKTPNFQENKKTQTQQSTPSPSVQSTDSKIEPDRNTQRETAIPASRKPKIEDSGKSQTYQPEWKQAGRAQKWQPLPTNVGFKFDLSQLWGVQVISAIALFIPLFHVVKAILWFFVWKINDIAIKLRFYYPDDYSYEAPLRHVPIASAIAIVLLIASSPWFIDALLKLHHNLEKLSIENLSTQSPEAARVLQRVCRERNLPLPTLYVLACPAPVVLTYGNLRRTARISVSRGLLEQMADDEIAAIYATQLGHIVYRDFVLMSLGVLVALLPYTIYWQVCQWGERWQNSFLRFFAAAIASLSYGLYWLFRWPILWLSRVRNYYSDRLACEITGNPNGLTRALLKISIGITKDIEQQAQTSYLLESFELLNCLGNRQAMTLGSIYPHTAPESILAWDCLNPCRWWLRLNNSHALIGERLQILARYARHWKLETELDFTPELLQNSKLKAQNSKLFLQGSPYFGIFLGLALGGLLWIVGAISGLIKNKYFLLDWMWGDWSLMRGCLLIGISFGIFLRLNSFFPDIKPSTLQAEPKLPELLDDPAALPVDSQPVRLQGKLLGRPGIGNSLCQDLILQTATGLVKLHHFTWLGPIGNILAQSSHPSELVNRPLTATGWFHRGATPWIDVETIKTQGGKTIQGGHPVWSMILALAAGIWGAYIIYQGY